MTPAAATRHSCTCPQEVRANNHKNFCHQVWTSPEWKAIKDAWLGEHKTCEICGKPSQIIHHDAAWMYHDREAYLNPQNFMATCNRCHYQLHRGNTLCPKCRIHYMPRDNDMCRWCSGKYHKRPDIKKPRKYRPKHQCANKSGMQKCTRNGRTYICTYSSRTGRERCEHFREREVMA